MSGEGLPALLIERVPFGDRGVALGGELDDLLGQPGGLPGDAAIEGAHEKGGVEGQIGWFRRDHFVPVPGEPFETGRHFALRVDRHSQISRTWSSKPSRHGA